MQSKIEKPVPSASRTDRHSKIVEPEWEILPPEERDRRKSAAPLFKWVAVIMDGLLKIPGSKRKLGLNPIIDLLPVVGDVSAGVVSASVLIYGLTRGLPKILLARMALNVAINELIGAIPFIGSAFAFWFRPNERNHRMLQHHIDVPTRPTKGDWIFVVGIIAAVFAIIVLGLLFYVWLLHELLKLLGFH